MNSDTKKLLKLLSECDLEMNAFHLARTMRGGVYTREIARALTLFLRVPCPETAAVLASVMPEVIQVLAASRDANGFDRVVTSTPSHMRGPAYEQLDEYMESFQRNTRIARDLHAILCQEAQGNSADPAIGGSCRDLLLRRMAAVGIKKRWWATFDSFVGQHVPYDLRALLATLDLVVIQLHDDGNCRLFTMLGEELQLGIDVNGYIIIKVRDEADRVIATVVNDL